MKNIKRDLPIYALSASLVFLGISISGNQAAADPSQVTSWEFSKLKMDFDSFKRCSNQNFSTISFFDAKRNSRLSFVQNCR
jgi:hypothetical protein